MTGVLAAAGSLKQEQLEEGKEPTGTALSRGWVGLSAREMTHHWWLGVAHLSGSCSEPGSPPCQHLKTSKAATSAVIAEQITRDTQGPLKH